MIAGRGSGADAPTTVSFVQFLRTFHVTPDDNRIM